MNLILKYITKPCSIACFFRYLTVLDIFRHLLNREKLAMSEDVSGEY